MTDVSLSLISRIKNAFVKINNLPRALVLVWIAGKGLSLSQLFLLVLQGLLPVAQVYLTKLIIDSIVKAVGEKGNWELVEPVILYAALLGASILISQLFDGILQMIRTLHAERLEIYIYELIHEKSIAVDLAFYEQPDYFDHLHRARIEATFRPQQIMNYVSSLLQNSVTLIAMAGVLLPFGWWLPLMLFFSTLPAFYIVLRFTFKQHEWRRKNTVEERRAGYYDWLLTSAESAAELRLFGLGNFFKSRFEVIKKRLMKERFRHLVEQRIAEIIAALFALILTAAAIFWMLFRVINGFATLGDLALFYQAFQQGQTLMRSLLQNVGQLYANSLFIGDLFEFLALEPKVINRKNAVEVPQKLETGISFENLSFNYKDHERHVLRNFNLEIPANKIVAIVGANGAGKSTLIKLLCRFYDVEDGVIKLDGKDLRDYSVEGLRKMITVLFQTPLHYSATVKENIELGRVNESVSHEEIEVAAKDSGADVTINRLPKGYNNLLGNWFPNGTELSVGEWQRIALARAFIRESPIILLDEPTSAMDPWAETDWLERLLRKAKERTVVIITHRFTTAMHADIIHVMEEGCVVETGTHEELLAIKGRYAKSWAAQMREKDHTQSTKAEYAVD